MYCCEKCFKEKEIVNYIIQYNKMGKCSFCHEDSPVYIRSAKEVGDFIRDGVRRAYEHVDEMSGAMWDGEEKRYIGPSGEEAGESLLDILLYSEDIFNDDFDEEQAAELLEALMDESGLSFRDKKYGGTDIFEDIHSPVFVIKNDLYGVQNSEYYIAWEQFKYICKYFNRYFDVSSNSIREGLLKNLEPVFKKMEVILKKGHALFRARTDKVINNAANFEKLNSNKEISPAPVKYAQNNRMSPAGISYLYASDDKSACFREVKADIGQNVLLGELTAKRDLKIVDLSNEVSLLRGSIFSSSYNHSLNWFRDFIRMFHDEISKAVDEKDKALEYVATQVLAEYIRKLGYDGIRYKSSLKKDVYNYALFCGPLHETDYTHMYMDICELTEYTHWFFINKITYGKMEEKDRFKVIYEKNN